MTPRERVLACLQGEVPDAVPMRDAPLSWAVARWEKEGLRSGGFPDDLFENCIDGTGYDETLRLPEEILADDGRVRTVRTADGATRKLLPGVNSIPEDLDWAIRSRADWDRFCERLCPSLDRVPKETLAWLKEIGQKKHAWSCVVVTGFFQRTVQMVGMTQALEMLVTDRAWAGHIYDRVTNFTIGMIDMLRQAGVAMDGLYYVDDMAYKNGPLFSPRTFQELMVPRLSQLFGYVHGWGGHVLFHTDGHMAPLIPGMIEAGVDILDPLEVKAGMDLGELTRRFGRTVVYEGNIDARVLYRGDRWAIEAEVRKKLSAAADGGYIYRIDGPITDEASFDSYRWLIDCVRKHGRY